MAFVYILKSEQGKYYVGSTTNLNARLAHHKGGYTSSTKGLGNLQLVFKQEYDTLKVARTIEKKLKSFKRKDFLDKIIKDGFIIIKSQ